MFSANFTRFGPRNSEIHPGEDPKPTLKIKIHLDLSPIPPNFHRGDKVRNLASIFRQNSHMSCPRFETEQNNGNLQCTWSNNVWSMSLPNLMQFGPPNSETYGSSGAPLWKTGRKIYWITNNPITDRDKIWQAGVLWVPKATKLWKSTSG